MQYVAPRQKGSAWAPSNKARVERLTAAGQMAPAGLAVVERAQEDGSWSLLDAIERLGASGKKQVLWSLVSAKREATRTARLARLVERAESGELLVP